MTPHRGRGTRVSPCGTGAPSRGRSPRQPATCPTRTGGRACAAMARPSTITARRSLHLAESRVAHRRRRKGPAGRRCLMWGARAPAAARMPSTVAGARGRFGGTSPPGRERDFWRTVCTRGTFVRTKAGRTLRARRRPARARATAGPRPAGPRTVPEGLAHAAVAKEVHEALPDERVRLDTPGARRESADGERRSSG
jgi:hypothetical protein